MAAEGQEVKNWWLEEEIQRKQREEVTYQAVKVAYQAEIAKGMKECLVEGVLQEEGPQVGASTYVSQAYQEAGAGGKVVGAFRASYEEVGAVVALEGQVASMVVRRVQAVGVTRAALKVVMVEASETLSLSPPPLRSE